MTTRKQVQAAERNVKKAQSGPRKKKTIANLPGRSKMGRAELARALGHE